MFFKNEEAFYTIPNGWWCIFSWSWQLYLSFVCIHAKIHGISFDLQIKTIDMIKNDLQWGVVQSQFLKILLNQDLINDNIDAMQCSIQIVGSKTTFSIYASLNNLYNKVFNLLGLKNVILLFSPRTHGSCWLQRGD